MGQYEDFSTLTRRSLKHALSESSCYLSGGQTDELMQAYDSLSCFPDVEQTLESLKTAPDLRAVVFSNGTHEMVSSSVQNSPDLSPHADVFDDIIVVEEVRKFKPAPEVYSRLARKVGKDPQSEEQMKEIWLVSGNPFDVVGARAVGMNAVWVDRAGTGWQDSLVEGEKGRPTEVVKSLDQVVATVMSSQSDKLTEQWREMHRERNT
ncbi:hypothetical protein BAUCODRAFT_119809 [Baudoinia panamericana UAMH 10762]|uniref:Haloacid dehalogenase n=1 Tax=Baudoinia panamericana (strain UAMH 10762) TaxID=717646 RepID=M2LZW4_BAUPA|nr:uncharacterized protein BAUCODRAFT_119809 [Baudoinia panamericana UAMH 10762]EMD00263.1 hypothetical protein BAUCODRAFT_119809 [Baudoinia panamericana UAMH 10762]